MRLAISQIAWDVAEDEAVAALLKRYRIDAIDTAPGKYFPDPKNADAAAIAVVRDWWAVRNIEITGMQALLFGTTGLNLFGTPEVQQAMLDQLEAVCRIAAGLGAPRLVFGSPKNRDRSGLSDQQAADIALPFFRRLGDIAAAHGVVICLEPNPACYACNFMTSADETASMVRRVDHPGIRMQLDTGAIAINGEDADALIAAHAPLIGHIHASEPQLVPLGDDALTPHGRIAAAVAAALPAHVVSIEMLATKDEPHLQSIERALQAAIRHYRPQQAAQGETA